MKCCVKVQPADDEYVEYTCRFNSSFSIPHILMNGTVNEVQDFLGFFDTFMVREHEAFERRQAHDVGAAIEESVKKQLGEEHALVVERMRRDLEAAERRYNAVAGEMAGVKGQLDVLLSANKALEDDIRLKTEDIWRSRLTDLKAEQERMCDFLKEQLASVKDELRSAQERLMARESVLKSSVRRGRAGEDGFAEAALAAVGWQLQRISDQARACDFAFNYEDCLVRFEIKNHETSVPGDDIKKFRRDLEEHRNDTGIGVFVALNAHLGGFMKGRLIHQEWKDDSGQLLIYISAFNELDADFVFLLLKQVFDVFLKYKALREDGGDEHDSNAEALKARIDNAMIHCQSMNKHLRDLTLKVGRDKKTVMKMYDDSLELLKSISSEYSLMMGLMLGNETPATMEEPMPEPLPSTLSDSIIDTGSSMNDIVIVEATPIEGVPKKKRAAKKTTATTN